MKPEWTRTGKETDLERAPNGPEMDLNVSGYDL